MPVEVTASFAGEPLLQVVVPADGDLRIGTAPGCAICVPGFTSWPLVDVGGQVRIPVGAQRDGEDIVLGRVRIEIATAVEQPRLPRPRIDTRIAPYAAVLLALHVGVWALAMVLGEPRMPPPPPPPRRMAYIIPKTPMAPPPPAKRDHRPPPLNKAQAAAAGASGGAGLAEIDMSPPASKAEAQAYGTRAARAITEGDVGADLARGMGALMGTVNLREALANTYPLYREEEHGEGQFGGTAGNFTPELKTIATGRYATVSTGRAAGEHYDLPGNAAASGPVDVAMCEGAGCRASGAMDSHSVTSWIEPHAGELRACFGLGSGSDGRVVVAFVIDGRGAVSGVRANGLGKVGGCVASVISTIAFPRTDALTRVVYPVDFRRG